ncbi:hypothetical protein LTR36_010221 [Oleoguttula mirabilis]|uniref:Uncharacterized protein n=1 Tax=Oleoguttula mirabilis TaxID=1507867 RepID=A0AAV9JSH6_9PEZI|nr:hypothetical protein LTR36_010221 [Oleoguttula mirabilis]
MEGVSIFPLTGAGGGQPQPQAQPQAPLELAEMADMDEQWKREMMWYATFALLEMARVLAAKYRAPVYLWGQLVPGT